MKEENQTPAKGIEPIRILLVDDSQAYRNWIAREFAKDAEFEVVSHATNGKLALPRIRFYQPDFVILDQEMPELDGLATLRIIRENWPRVGVIMFSSHTVEGARITLQALELGALDFVTKPSGDADISAYLQKHLISRIKSIARSRRERSLRAVQALPIRTITGTAEVCAIGISTGGPVALRQLLTGLPAGLNGAILVVQHMPPMFTAQLAQHLNGLCNLNIVEAANDMQVESGNVYIAPGGRHMIVERNKTGVHIKITDVPPELNCRPSVNILFRSVADVYGSKAMALIMTGMGEDGLDGIRTLRKCDASVFAQDPESCVVYGMPAGPVRDGLVDGVLDIPGLTEKILQRFGSKL